NAVLDDLNGKQFSSEFSPDRYAVLFKQGEYDDKIVLRPGYYTTYSGLGTSPDDVKIRSLVNPNRESPINNALINFWRGVENMTFTSDSKWAVSQGTFLRRVNVNGRLDLHDVGGYASGGFIADSKISGTVEGGSQQQWLMYNSEMQGWGGNVWNMC
ncbi:MAG: hypothetical protein OSJ83_12500, partial [Clostridia bacterium]|nr:hypothetical protein [Clostridia bacterium]